MSKVEKISVALSSELLETVQQAVATGEYASASEVIREALRDWKLRQPLRQAEVKRLQKAWKEGLASGKPEPFDIEEIKRRARARLDSTSDDNG
ncbi:type II toxin-antitoxin system ParD family antitoxin [Mesorhizobium sp. KR1-2]|uniref:type II toxin-antitoxin system ParD family antitoxin n=1 Tax=Mesorhizobium sp. KR1-2 TaxID=3156609 RepID=UPI0032B50190